MTKQYQPRMHSAEHLLNSVMVAMFDCDRCFSAHINKKKSKCDYKFDRALTDEEVGTIGEKVNAAIDAGAVMLEEFVTPEQAADLYNLTRLPEGVDSVRIVHLGDFDACPCIGEHVENTKEIGEFTITTHSFEDGVLRIRYKLGQPEE